MVGTVETMSAVFLVPRTGMINVPATISASVVAVAASDTLVTPCLANVERQSLAVLRDVWRDIVFTHASVGKGIRVALVVDGGHGGDTRLLEADEWALSSVLITPEF